MYERIDVRLHDSTSHCSLTDAKERARRYGKSLYHLHITNLQFKRMKPCVHILGAGKELVKARESIGWW